MNNTSNWKKVFGTVAVLAVLVMSLGITSAFTFADAPTENVTRALFQGDEERERGDNPLADYLDEGAVEAAVAGALGISVEELQAAREDGTRLPDLAAELGVDMADVQAAVQAVKEEAVAAALADGAITEEQAERILSQDGFGPKNRRGGPRGDGQAAGVLSEYMDEGAMQAAVADALGISVDELTAAREEGTRLPDLADELGVDMAEIEAATQAVKEEAVAQALADGAITEEQAERILNHECDGRHGRGGRGGNGAPQGAPGFNGAPQGAPGFNGGPAFEAPAGSDA